MAKKAKAKVQKKASASKASKKTKVKAKAPVKSKTAQAQKKSAAKPASKKTSQSQAKSKSKNKGATLTSAMTKQTQKTVESSGKSVSTKVAGQTMKLLKALDLHPLADRVLVVLDSNNERLTPGGLIIPDSVKDSSGNRKGQVVAAGKGQIKKNGQVLPLDVKAGDQVLFSEYAGNQIQFAGEQYVILRENEILGIVL